MDFIEVIDLIEIKIVWIMPVGALSDRSIITVISNKAVV